MQFHEWQKVEVLDTRLSALPPHEHRVWRKARIVHACDKYGMPFVVEFPDETRVVYIKNCIHGSQE